jgi:hypothetical protein
MIESRKFNHEYHLSRWKTYLWVMIIISMFSIYINLYFREILMMNSMVRTESIKMLIILPNMILILGWTMWFLIFVTDLNRFYGIRDFDDEDFDYVNRKYSRYFIFYRMFDMIIAMYFIFMLMTSMLLFFRF